MPVNFKLLKQLRQDEKMTQEQLGEKLGLSGVAYAHYETGHQQMDSAMLERLADELGTSTDYLLGRTAQAKPYPKRKIV